MEKPITLTVLSTQTRAEIRDTITAGDSDAYPLSITFSDLTAITGTVRFRFVRGDDYWDRDATIDGNTVSLMLEPDFYAAPRTELWLSFEDSNLYTPLHVYFRDIRVPGGNVEVATSQTYPAWAEDMREFDVDIGTVTTLAEGADATASITGTIPDKVLNLGIPKGDKGDAGEITIGTVTTLDPGESATVVNSGTSTDAVLDIGIPGSIPIDDASTAADRVLSAQYVKGQLAQKIPLTRQTKYWNRPAAYKIKVSAGRFNMLWDNTISTMWVFPAGTVQYSDGITPIRTSTDAKPDVTIPAGGGYVWLVSAMWDGPYTLRSYDTSAILTSALADLPPLTDTLNLSNCSQVTGDLADLPPLANTLNLSNCSQVTGDLADLPPLAYRLNLDNCSNVTGALSDLPPLTFSLNLVNCSQVTGDLADLPPVTYILDLSNCSQVTGAYTAVNGDNVPTTTTLTGTGLSATDMDATLIAYAACTKTGGTFTATGKNRTTASDAAVLHLTTPTGSGGLGWTVTGLTVV